MSNRLKQCLIFVSILTFLITPSRALAAINPSYVYENDYGNYKYFEFDTGYIANPGQSIRLENNENNGNWHVQIGQTLSFNCGFVTAGTFKYTIYRATPQGGVIIEETVYSDNFGITSMPMEVEGEYMIIVTAINTAAIIHNYSVEITPIYINE